uniref:Uncharacterized protein n=1 Tax=Anguilla anguilla TaxID=7936 RepID=A0A0E9XEH2_ANGAN
MRHNKNNNVPVNNQMPPVTRLADSVLSLAVLCYCYPAIGSSRL